MNTEAFANSKIVHFIFRVIGAAMESRFRYRFLDPMTTLRGVDIKPGLTVLEVGCGTGFFTVPAAQLIADQGCFVAMDVLPVAIERVSQKVQAANLKNVRVVKGDAMNTGLEAESMDAVLLFGVIPAPMLPLKRLLPEMHRILKPEGERGALATYALKVAFEWVMKWGYIMTRRSTIPKMLNIVASILVAVACLAGCSTVRAQHTGNASEALEPGETLTVVLDYVGGSPEEAAKLEARLSECVQQALHEAGQASKLIPPDEFRRLVFPGLDITTAPRSTESLVSLLKVPQFRQKIDSLRLRYLITVREESSSQSENVAIVGGYPPAPILGSAREKRTNLTARIIEMKSASETGAVSTTAESIGFYGVVGIVPIIVPPMTDSKACQRFGSEVVKFISSRTE
jgi:SAM-dependent methyltransferase